MKNFEHNKIYRFISRADEDGRALNAFSASKPAALTNVCLYDDTPDDECQQWIYKETSKGNYFVCKANTALALDQFTGSSSVSGVTNYNAHLYAPSKTSYIIPKYTRDSNGNVLYVKLQLAEDITKYLTANEGASGTAAGKDVNAAGNVYWYKSAGVTPMSQDWIPIDLEDEETKPDPEPPTDFPTKQYLVPPFPFTGVTADFGRDCEPIAAAQDAGKKVCNAYPYNFHYGIDLIGKKKNPNNENTFVADMNIRSSGYGEVISVRTPSNPESVALGNTVLVKYPKAAYGSGSSKRDIYFLYCHLASVAVSETDKVYPGELIGVEGASGYGADYAHLHLEAYTSKIETSATESGSIGAVDPTPYLFNKEQESDDYGYGRGTIVPDCDSPFWGAAYCDGSTNGCTHDNKLYYYNLSKIRNRGDFKNPTF